MPQKHTHAYSNYVHHILNSSPTKITYTFPKQQRFSPSNPTPKTPVDLVLQKAFPSPPKKIPQTPKQITTNKTFINHLLKHQSSNLRYPATAGHPNRKHQLNRSSSISQNKDIFPFEKYLNNEIIRKSPSSNTKKFQRSKSTKAVRLTDKQLTPPKPFQANKSAEKKKKVWGKNESPQKQQKKVSFQRMEKAQNIKKQARGLLQFPENSSGSGANKYLKYSPYYRQYLRENGEQNSLSRQKKGKWKGQNSRQKSKRRHSRIKTSTTVLEEMNHPSKHITVQGYYPVGVELNPNGKYVPSNYKNAPAHSFGKSPSKNDKNKQNSLTPQKNTTLFNNPAQMFPQASLYYRALTQKKSHKQTKTIEERYVPFSQFGNPTSYRY